MERKIELKMVDSNHYWVKGIYLIRIGRMKYVGRANCIGERMKTHQYEINRAMKNFGILINGMGDKSVSGSYKKVARYLLENPSISYGTVEVLERQVCSNMMYFSENFYLKEITGDCDCYNELTSSPRPGNEKDNLWDAAVSGNDVICFDPRFPRLKVSTAFSANQNKITIKAVNDEKNKPEYRRKMIFKEKNRLLDEFPHLKSLILTETIKRLMEIK